MHLYPAYAAWMSRQILFLFLRVILWSVLTGAICIFIIWKIYPDLPAEIFSTMWVATLAIPAMTFIFYLIALIENGVRNRWAPRPRYEASTYGIGGIGNLRRWERFTAFTVERGGRIEGLEKLVLFRNRGCPLRLPLAEGVKRRLVIRFIARHLPLREGEDGAASAP